jgi:hypothetical protein
MSSWKENQFSHFQPPTKQRLFLLDAFARHAAALIRILNLFGDRHKEISAKMNSSRTPITQTALDIINVVFGLLFVLALASSVPLAIALMMFASF